MKTLRYILICTAAVLAAASCGKKGAMGPEEVVEAFSRAVATGDFETARTLCDTIYMYDYIENYQKVMTSLQKEDSSAFAIAVEMISGAEFEVTGVDKNGEEKTVTYKFTADGNGKTKKATVKKEEGEWKVKSITDAI